MIDPEIQRMIRLEVQRHVQVILAGLTGSNSESKEDIQSLYPGMATIPDRPVMHPFGFVSRAKSGTVQVTGRMGENFGNWVVLGHRDKDRPTEIKEGESILYNTEYKLKIYLKNDGFEIEVDGVKLLDQLIKLLTTIINARTNTIFGPQPLIPNPVGVVNGEDWTMIKQKLTEMKGEA